MDIWILPEKGTWLHRARRQPIQLTAGPVGFGWPVPDKTGKRIFVFGLEPKSEFLRYDAHADRFEPFLQGTQLIDTAFSSPDGQWIAYTAYPQMTLWRSRPDGTERLQLTSEPLIVLRPRWSPDGKRIAFVGWRVGEQAKLYLLPAEGGTPQELALGNRGEENPDWSPDGKLLVFNVRVPFASGSGKESHVEVFDLATGRASRLPGSDQMMFPKWSPDGESLAALSLDVKRLMVYTFRTQQWTELAQGSFLNNPLWSHDGRYVYVQDKLAADQPILRFRVADGRRERVVSCGRLLRSGVQWCGFAGLTPDGSPLVVLSRSFADIYALDVDLP
jgi:Tol biopolymer transport system component